MAAEAEAHAPRETGGVLMGTWLSSSAVSVTEVIGPGPRASHRRNGFEPDYEYHERQIARIYEASGRIQTYLGDWHSHPGGISALSKKDEETLRGIAAYNEARAPVPLMAIIAGGDPWTAQFWAARSLKRFWGKGLEIVPLTLTLESR
jgi:integrative and conjugative element protein (TIGR02256 family)